MKFGKDAILKAIKQDPKATFTGHTLKVLHKTYLTLMIKNGNDQYHVIDIVTCLQVIDIHLDRSWDDD